jgi:hypothetical protein
VAGSLVLWVLLQVRVRGHGPVVVLLEPVVVGPVIPCGFIDFFSLTLTSLRVIVRLSPQPNSVGIPSQ